MDTLSEALELAEHAAAALTQADVMVNAADILNASILVVDDQEANVSLLERMLRGAGYTAVVVDDGSARGLRAAAPDIATA